MSKLTQEEIYNALIELFPGEYVHLKQIPKNLPKHPGDKPQERPDYSQREITVEFEFGPNATIQDIAKKASSLPTKQYTIHHSLCVIRHEEKEYEEYDYTLGEYVTKTRLNPVYGEKVDRLYLRATYPNPEWDSIVRAQKAARKSWEDKMRSYKQRKAEIQGKRDSNKNLIETVRAQDFERWCQTARYLKGKASAEFLAEQREALLERAAGLQRLIDAVEAEENNNE